MACWRWFKRRRSGEVSREREEQFEEVSGFEVEAASDEKGESEEPEQASHAAA